MNSKRPNPPHGAGVDGGWPRENSWSGAGNLQGHARQSTTHMACGNGRALREFAPTLRQICRYPTPFDQLPPSPPRWRLKKVPKFSQRDAAQTSLARVDAMG
ncbi:Mce family protein [Anopheles sinensis]|uniref:Mce family protein n=1 Tax=Anopheles sinensis TaxID=74873 RepID=A0A084VHZ8_ANOSI|nr:Mce family protein [Anopheles sinensis]